MDQHELAVNAQQEGGRSYSTPQPYDHGASYPPQWQAREVEEEGFISFRFLIRALSQWWYIALPLGCVLAVIAAAIVMLTFTPAYRSTAVLKIASYTPYIAYTSNEQPMNPEEFTETQVELLRSPLVMEQVINNPRIAGLEEMMEKENPATWLSKNIRVDQVGNSELYNVYLDATHPDDSSILVNSILDEYFAVRSRDEESQTARVLELLQQEKQIHSDEIERLQNKMRALGKNVMGADPVTGIPTPGNNSLLGELKDLGDKVSQAGLDSRMLELEIKVIRESIEKRDIQVGEVEVEVAISESQEISDLRILISNKKANLHQVESAAASGKNDPSYRRLQREIVELERSLEGAAAQSRPQITEQLKTMAALDNRDLLKQLEAELSLKSSYEVLLNERYEEKLKAANASGDKLMDLQFTKAELAREESVFDKISERAMALTTEARAPGRVSLLSSAEPPLGPVESLPLRNLAAAIFASGCFPFGLALLWELSVRRIGDVDQLSQHASLPVVGEVAKLPMRIRALTPGGSRALSLFEESIDSLRVGLILPDQNKDLQVIAITSAVHSEGKSSVSSQLAVSIGRSIKEPVLLIDGDLRVPDVHHIFEVSNDLGMAAVLDGRATLEEAIITTWSDTVHLLPAGRLKKSPHKLMSIEILKELLDELRTQYRYIVIDTPPILSASEALMLAKVADGTVLSTRRNVSRESQVRIAYERLMKAGARPMGAVFNGVPTRSYASTYGSYEYAQNFDS
ncbi:MAG: GumC family protein [Rubripirellula sp.]